MIPSRRVDPSAAHHPATGGSALLLPALPPATPSTESAMGKTQISIPLVTLRPDGDGGFRPRYIPGKKHRTLGLKGEDLRHDDGRWFSLDECAAWSAARVKLVADLEGLATPKARRQALSSRVGITLSQAFERFFEQPRMNGIKVVEGKKEREPLGEGTVAYYKSGARVLEDLDGGLLWVSPVRAISASMLGDEKKGVLHKVEVAKGVHVSLNVRRTLSVLFAWLVAQKAIDHNPVKAIAYKIPTPAPRIRVGSREEMAHLVQAADLIGRPDIGDAIMLGLWTGQRQSDRLKLVDGQDTPDGIHFRQGKKHGQPLLIPKAPTLSARLAAARHRRRDWRVNYPNVILDEEAKRPFLKRWYGEIFSRVRKAAAEGIAGPDGWRLEPMPSLADFHDQDLRDTSVTWLALAGCTKPEIASITGHSLATIDDVLKHYLGLHPDLARSAIGKLVAWDNARNGGEGNAAD
jgi:integrase